MIKDNIILFLILALGIIGNSTSVAAAAAILLVMKFMNLQLFFPPLEKRGLDLVILFLVLAILAPIAMGKININDISHSLKTFTGIIAIIGGIFTAHLSGRGVALLEVEPDIIIGLIVGTIIGTCFLNGIPVGPLNAAGITAILLMIFK